MRKVYLAGPMFTKNDLAECIVIENLCEKLNIDYFSPRQKCSEDGKILSECNALIKENRYGKAILNTRDKAATNILSINHKGILEADYVLANTRDFDSGTMYEFGFAIGNNIPVISYNFKNYGSNVMLSQSCVYHSDLIDMNQQDELALVMKKMDDLLFEGLNAKELRKSLFKIKDMEIL